MKILALEKDIPGNVAGDNAPLLQDEARAVWELMQSGIIREIHFRERRSLAVILLEAESTVHAQQLWGSCLWSKRDSSNSRSSACARTLAWRACSGPDRLVTSLQTGRLRRSQ